MGCLLHPCEHTPVPNVKSDRDRGYIGAWMRRERLARDWSNRQVLAALNAHGVRFTDDAYYRQVEAGTNGKRPGPELLAALVAIYGTKPEPFPVPEPVPASDLGDLVAAIRELVAEMRLSRAAQPDVTQVVERVAAALAAGGRAG